MIYRLFEFCTNLEITISVALWLGLDFRSASSQSFKTNNAMNSVIESLFLPNIVKRITGKLCRSSGAQFFSVWSHILSWTWSLVASSSYVTCSTVWVGALSVSYLDTDNAFPLFCHTSLFSTKQGFILCTAVNDHNFQVHFSLLDIAIKPNHHVENENPRSLLFSLFYRDVENPSSGYEQVPIDSMQGLDLGSQHGSQHGATGGGYGGPMDNLPDLTNSGELNFDSLGNPPGDNPNLWFDTDV